MTRIKNFFLKDETGLALSQSAMTTALIATFCVTTFIALSGGLGAALQNLKDIVLGG